jgi:hypothetical protein
MRIYRWMSFLRLGKKTYGKGRVKKWIDDLEQL